jgi:hypothetical protein
MWYNACEQQTLKNVAVATDHFEVQSQHLFGALTRTTEYLIQKYVLRTTG